MTLIFNKRIFKSDRLQIEAARTVIKNLRIMEAIKTKCLPELF